MESNLHKILIKMSKWCIYGIVIQISVYTMAFAFNSGAQNKRVNEIEITLDLKAPSKLEDVLGSIESSTDFHFSFRDKQLKSSSYVLSLDTKEISLGDLLLNICMQTDLSFRRINDNIYIVKKQKGIERITESIETVDSMISGAITDENGDPLPGATVLEKGTTNGTITDVEGKFSFSVSEGATILISFVGYKSKEISVSGMTQINISLEPDFESLEEVVVIGYGTAKKKDLTGAIATVDLKKTEALPNINLAQSMRGTIAGVTVTDTGRPGAEPIINIRGTNSISASNDPLIVLDGIIYRGGKLSDINPGDIESIHILKDASSTAVYGSLAANGVIELTTKKGTSMKPTVSVNSYYGFADYAHLPDYLNAKEYLEHRLDAEAADGGSLPFQPIEQENIDAGKSIDPFDAISQKAPIFNTEISVGGTSEDLTYRVSTAYLDSHSPVAGDNFKRISGRVNLDLAATKWLTIGLNSGYSLKDEGGNRANLLFTSYMSPYASLFYEDGVPIKQPMDLGLVPNPIFGNEWNKMDRKYKTLFVNAYADVQLPLKGLTYRLNFGYTKNENHDFSYNPSYDRGGFSNLGSGSKYYFNSNNITLENIIRYSRLFGKHTLNATLMYGVYESEDEFSDISSKNIGNDALGWNSLELGEAYTINTGAGKDQQISSMGRLGYIFNEKYIIDASVRRDGYSAFGAGNKFGLFPAVGASWNLSNEEFMSNIRVVDRIKIRLSWGKNGNRGIGRYSSLSNMADTYYVFGSNTAVGQYITSMANPNLGWESTTSTNLAVDFSVLSQRINGSIDIYKSTTKDLLLKQSIPNTNGFDQFLRNVGEVGNTGVEISLNTINVSSGGFIWSSDFAFTHNKNEILKLTGQDLDGDGIEDDDIASKWFIGKSLGSNFDYVFDGIYQEGDDFSLITGAKPGDIRFKDISGPEGVPDGVITPDDRTVLHNNRPKYTLGYTNTFSFKGLSLMVVFTYRNGGYSPNSSLNPGTNFYDIANYLNVPYWTPENPINSHPAINYRNPLNYGFYQSRTYARLQDVSLSYTFPEEVAKRMHVNNFQIYASGKNLATWTNWQGWDSEYGAGARDPGNYGPLMKIYTLGLKVQL
ncbi:MAG: TonB-dependent receptor [Cyclobacteriaceae bacterium]